MNHDRLRSDDDFTSYVTSTARWLRREAYRPCGDPQEAEDLVQMTLYRVYRRWERLSQREALTGYTRQALLRTYLSERRRPRWRHEVSNPELPDRGYEGPSPDDRLVLIEAVNQLGPRQRAVVALRFWEDLSVEQTATVLGCATGTVASQTHHALRRLRVALSPPPPAIVRCQ